MQFAVDILLLGVFGLLAFLGWRRGFLKTVFSLGKLVLALILTILLGPSVAAWLDVTFVNPPVYEAVHEKFSALAAEAAATAQGSIDGLIQRIPAVFRGYLDVSRDTMTILPTKDGEVLVCTPAYASRLDEADFQAQ
jgi:hypothetical protein